MSRFAAAFASVLLALPAGCASTPPVRVAPPVVLKIIASPIEPQMRE